MRSFIMTKKAVATVLCLALLGGAWPAQAVEAIRPPGGSTKLTAVAPLAPAAGIALPPSALSPAAAPALPAESAAPALSALIQAGAAVGEKPEDAPKTLDQQFDGKAKESASVGTLKEVVKELASLRLSVQQNARDILQAEMGGDFGDGRLHRDLKRVMRRLTKAAGLGPQAAQVFTGNSFLPNAFTTITQAEHGYLTARASIAKAFRISNIFVSLGLLRAVRSEAQLAFVLAHELMHNTKGHLKSFSTTRALLGHFHELEADAEALKLVAAAGYDPREAIDSLYALDAEYERLSKKYALLGQDKGDVQKTIERLRDIHPHSDLRKAHMLDHMNEALERYAPAPEPESPVWMARRNLEAHPSHLDRFEAKLQRLTAQTDLEATLHDLEAFIVMESQKRAATTEEYAVIERVYRALAERAASNEELRYIEVSARRLGNSVFPSRRLRAALITRQLELSVGGRSRSTLEKFEKISASTGEHTRRAGALRLSGSVRDREDLDAVFRAFSREAENLGLDFSVHNRNVSVLPSIQLQTARRLWQAARKVLTAEKKAPALPEEIIDELMAKLSPSWLKHFHDAFNVEILESAFGPEAYRSQKYRPAQLAFKLLGRRPEDFERQKEKGHSVFKGLYEWSQRHYRRSTVEERNQRLVYNYERYYLDGVSSPSLADQLDIAEHFGAQGNHLNSSGYWDLSLLPKPFIQILRRENRLEPFLKAALEHLGAQLRKRLAESPLFWKQSEALQSYLHNSQALLDSALQGIREIKTIRETAAAVWEPTEALLAAPEVGAAFASSFRGQLARGFFASLSNNLRDAVVLLDRAGQRPPAAELGALAELVKRVEAPLRSHSGMQMATARARSLAAALHRRVFPYMRRYYHALPYASRLRNRTLWYRLTREVNELLLSMMTIASTVVGGFAILVFITLPQSWALRDRTSLVVAAAALFPALLFAADVGYHQVVDWVWHFSPSLAGIPRKEARNLSADDFVHFLAMAGDATLDAKTKLAAAALLDRLDLPRGSEHPVRMHAAVAVGRWLVEDAVRACDGPAAARLLVGDLLRINDRHPGFLQADLLSAGNSKTAFREGAFRVRRNEPYRGLARGEHPFRAANSRWAAELTRVLDRDAAWPENTEDRLDLLDLLNSTGEFSDALDLRVIETAQADRAGFHRWIARDRARVARWPGDQDHEPSIRTPVGDIPLPSAQPLRLVRNPSLRARLFDFMPESRLGEKARFSLIQRWRDYRRLWKAYRTARRYFSAKFLKEIQHEGSLEEKFFQVIEEIDRYASAEAEKARRRWDSGDFLPDDFPEKPQEEKPKTYWNSRTEDKKEEIVAAYRRRRQSEAMRAIMDLYAAYAEIQEPALGQLLKNYPEPTRARDELLERIIKARRLSPAELSFLESNKSYRQPNPLRIAEKHLLDAAVIQMAKFTAAERVDILLHLADVAPLSEEKQSLYNRRVLSGDRKKLARDYASIRSLAQLKNYMTLLHAKDRSMLIRAQFHGDTSLHKDPEQVRRLYESLVIEGRGLPPFLEKTFKAYFKILTPDERSKIISDLAAVENVGKNLTGPQILRIALRNLGVTGAKVAQVLATHQGLLPPAYGDALGMFLDKAQDMDKMRAFGVASARLEKLKGALAAEADREIPPFAGLDAWSKEALPKVGEAARRAITAQIDYLLRKEGRKISAIEELGPELGSGSIKVVYKITLDDKRVWVAKTRAPGAAYSVSREFEILDELVGSLQAQGDLDLPGARQLLEEVQNLVRAEMDFTAEAAKESAMRSRVAARPWYARLLGAPRPYVPKPHAVYAGEDLLVEEFVPSLRFADLPRARLFGPSRRKIAAAAVREGMFGLVFENWLEPDPHAGNRHARRGGLYRFWTKLVLMDLGQGEAVPTGRLKPLMKAALALQGGDAAEAAARLMTLVKVPDARDASEVRAALQAGLSGDKGVIERLMAGLVEAEKKGALVGPEYASLQKAFILYTGYSPLLPKDYLLKSLERAVAARLIKDGKISAFRLIRLGFKKTGARRVEMEALVDAL